MTSARKRNIPINKSIARCLVILITFEPSNSNKSLKKTNEWKCWLKKKIRTRSHCQKYFSGKLFPSWISTDRADDFPVPSTPSFGCTMQRLEHDIRKKSSYHEFRNFRNEICQHLANGLNCLWIIFRWFIQSSIEWNWTWDGLNQNVEYWTIGFEINSMKSNDRFLKTNLMNRRTWWSSWSTLKKRRYFPSIENFSFETYRTISHRLTSKSSEEENSDGDFAKFISMDFASFSLKMMIGFSEKSFTFEIGMFLLTMSDRMAILFIDIQRRFRCFLTRTCGEKYITW